MVRIYSGYERLLKFDGHCPEGNAYIKAYNNIMGFFYVSL